MKTYIGTKLVKMTPMNRADYNTYRGWTLPADENGTDEGYLVEYLDGGKPNHPDHEGYISWSPKAQAEAAYRETSGLTFGLAVEALKKGMKVARAGWNGKGMWLEYVNEGVWFVNTLDGERLYRDQRLPWIGMKTADNKFVPWLASQTDVLAEDWMIVE